MWQLLGMSLLWGGLALLQLAWPTPLPALSAAPALCFIGLCLSLYLVPSWRLYILALIFFGALELMVNGTLLALFPALLVLGIPLKMQSPEPLYIWPRAMLMLFMTTLWFELGMMLMFIPHGFVAFDVFWQHIFPLLIYHVLWGSLMWWPLKWYTSVLHYQRFEYYSDARKGTLG